MNDLNDSASDDEGTLDGDGSATTQSQTDSPEHQISLMRKRQAGAEAARQEATRQLTDAQARLAKYEAADRDADQTKAADIATLQAKLEAAEKRASDADSNANAKILDIKYPNARAKLQEITDEIRLAEFEALFTEAPEAGDPPKPQNPNESNRSSSSGATGTQPQVETSEDIKARLRSMTPNWN